MVMIVEEEQHFSSTINHVIDSAYILSRCQGSLTPTLIKSLVNCHLESGCLMIGKFTLFSFNLHKNVCRFP